MSEILIAPLATAVALLVSIALLRKAGVPEGRFVVCGFVVFGAALGILSALLWPSDLGVYVNIPGTAAGDWIYRFSIEHFGDPYSDQAHYSIPWILRIPQVYAMASPCLYVLIGFPVQRLANGIRRQGKDGLDSNHSDVRSG
jgi:hypothetical protein